jgi:hypothetical protein
MARADLTKLLGVVHPENATQITAEEPPDGRTKEIGFQTARRTPQSSGQVVAAPEPLYRSYQRKETRLREEQQNELTLLARRLSRAKGSGGGRITENTLIRVAVDLLLARSAQLTGNNETALRNSLELP